MNTYFKIIKKILSIINKKYYYNIYFIKSISILFKPKFDSENLILQENSIFNKLKIARKPRLYYYVAGIEDRINNLLDEYLISNDLLIDSDDILVDVGSNIGEFTIGITKLYSFKKIIAVEPDPTEFEVLKYNLQSLHNVEFYNNVLSDIGEKTIKFYLNNESGDSSIDNETSSFIESKSISLNTLLDQHSSIGLLKLEAEGHEFQILKGSIMVLKKIKYITVDVGPELNGVSTFSEVNNFLTSHGFKIFNRGKTRDTVLYINPRMLQELI